MRDQEQEATSGDLASVEEETLPAQEEAEEERDRRSARRIRMKLPIRAKAGKEKHFYMRLVNISQTGMQTHGNPLASICVPASISTLPSLKSLRMW